MNTTSLVENRALHLSEQRHRLLADYAKDVIWSMSLEGAITYVSPAIFQLRGLTPEEAIQQPLDQILTPPSQAVVGQYFLDVLTAAQKGEKPQDFKGDLEYYRKDGSTFWTEVLAFPLADADGTLIEILGVTRDISARKLYEDELKAARDTAEKANQAKSDFVAHISHEVRTPMTALLAYMEQAMQTHQQDEQRDLLAKARTSGDMLLHLINDILDFSKIDSGKLEIKEKSFLLCDVAQQVTDVVAHSAKTKGLDYSVVVDVPQSTRLLGDAPRLTQALLNLASNAVKFTDQDFVRIHIAPVRSSHDKITLKFSVQDSGPGLSDDMCERVFERFVQGAPSHTSRNSGTGLGLPICKQLAQLMGGDAGVNSRLGHGSTFWFTVVLKADSSVAPAVGSSSHKPFNLSADLMGRRVLVVDDNEPVRDAITRLLKGHGMCVVQADSGQAALDRFKTDDFDVMLADIRMPLMSGIELTQILRASNVSKLKIIGVSAGAFNNDRQVCLAAGMDDHISKPFKIHDLLLKIQHNLALHN